MWIDLKTAIILNDKGLATSIQQEWLFGDFFSAALINDINKQNINLNDGLKKEISVIMNNLQKYNYFTIVNVDGNSTDLGKVKKFDVDIIGTQVWIKFILPIIKPVNFNKQHLTYSIFDPTYYIEMLHDEREEITFLGKKSAGCSVNIIQPNPSEEAITLSQSSKLDKNPDNSIGKLFAEIIDVSC